jgi:hypothetical protein
VFLLVIAPVDPALKIFWNGAQEHLAVDGTGATGHFAARHRHGCRDGGGGAGEPPVVFIIDAQEVGTCTPAKFEIVRE